MINHFALSAVICKFASCNNQRVIQILTEITSKKLLFKSYRYQGRHSGVALMVQHWHSTQVLLHVLAAPIPSSTLITYLGKQQRVAQILVPLSP